MEPSTGQPNDEPEPTSMTKAELLEYARAMGVEGVDGSMTKKQIVDAIGGEE